MQVQQGFSMPAGQLMGLDDQPLNHSQGPALSRERPLFQGSTFLPSRPQAYVDQPHQPHHHMDHQVSSCAVLLPRLTQMLHGFERVETTSELMLERDNLHADCPLVAALAQLLFLRMHLLRLAVEAAAAAAAGLLSET